MSRETWTADARYFEYSKAANPIGHATPKCPLGTFDKSLHQDGPSRIIPLDLSEKLLCPAPATSPNLCANFIRITAGERIETAVNATSELFFVIQGEGDTLIDGQSLSWETHDLFTLPLGQATHVAKTDSVLYWVHDQPLLTYLGVRADTPRFRPTLYRHEDEDNQLSAIRNDPEAKTRNRVSVLLANAQCAMTETATHVLWAMYGVLPKGATQLPHRHQSVALDLIISCKPGCYSLLGEELDGEGNIVNPIRADWDEASAFVTPPGWWHAHFNESGADAYLLPIQDAGLQTFMRSLDIHFFHKEHTSHISLKK
ncbi:MAG: cupin [Pseudomonadota bacterium]